MLGYCSRMGQTGNPGSRPYDSTRRREQAAATRRAVLEAARRLFERDGYTRTTMAAIAREAGVSAKTVYLAFESKRGVLTSLWHLLLRGDEEPVPVGERSWFRAVIDEPDPERKIRANQRNATAVRARLGGLLHVLRDAAPADPDVAELWARIQADFRANQREVVEDLDRRGALRPGLDVERAADVLWTLNHPDVQRLLVHERGWTPAEHERWTADVLCAELLGAGPAGTGG